MGQRRGVLATFHPRTKTPNPNQSIKNVLKHMERALVDAWPRSRRGGLASQRDGTSAPGNFKHERDGKNTDSRTEGHWPWGRPCAPDQGLVAGSFHKL